MINVVNTCICNLPESWQLALILADTKSRLVSVLQRINLKNRVKRRFLNDCQTVI